MRLRVFVPLLLAVAAAVGAPDAAAQYIYARPPAVRREYVPPRPSPRAVWVGGYWGYGPGGRYVWQPGRWDYGHPGRVWIEPRWVRTPQGWHMQPGYWRR